jgi:sugar phosphate isomerase/epimerase
MQLRADPPLHLTYCLNIHPGETWADNLAAMRTHALAVRDRVAPGQPFGLGLRLRRKAADELSRATTRAEFRRFLAEQGLYVFTINGFPYGAFHGTPVKTDVYRPDWRDAERRDYTVALADILADLLPEGTEGSISTVPGAYKAALSSADDIERIVGNLVDCVAHLHGIRQRTGCEIHLGLEPEPDCCLETTDEVVAFFESPLAQHGVPRLARALGGRADEACAILRRHLGVCFDTCHLAIQFEPLERSLRRLLDHGVRVSKIQISAALALPPTPSGLQRLAAFADPVYLHQVKVRGAQRAPAAFPDLPDALARPHPAAGPGEEWRVHFHVPLYYEGDRDLGTTATALTPQFFRAMVDGRISHLEIETYTFHVLPPALRSLDVASSIAREYAWIVPRLRAALRRG